MIQSTVLIVLCVVVHLTLEDGCNVIVDFSYLDKFANDTCAGRETGRLYDVGLKYNSEEAYASTCQVCYDFYTEQVIFVYNKLVTFHHIRALSNNVEDSDKDDDPSNNYQSFRKQALEFGKQYRINLKIYSGSYGLTSNNTLLWQLVYAPIKNQALTFLSFDNASYDICVDISKNITWINFERTNETFICTYEDLIDVIPYIPQIPVTGILKSKASTCMSVDMFLLWPLIMLLDQW